MSGVKYALLLLVAFAIPSLAKTREVHLYNIANGETMTLEAKSKGTGKGLMEGALTSGEQLHGEYVVVQNASLGWGSVYGSAAGSAGFNSASATGTSITMTGQRYGSSIVTGSKGTVLDCEFTVGANGHGTGICKDNHEARYRMMF
jgi:hypothetical protein